MVWNLLAPITLTNAQVQAIIIKMKFSEDMKLLYLGTKELTRDHKYILIF